MNQPAAQSVLLPDPAPLPGAAGQHLNWANLHGAADALAISELSQGFAGVVLLVTNNSARAQRWQGALEFLQSGNIDCRQFPDWETLPYDAFSPHQDIISERLATLRDLPRQQRGILTVPVTTLLQKIAPRAFLSGAGFAFSKDQQLDLAQQRSDLEDAGYTHTDTVTERGQYAVRGSVMDIFPMGAELPVRLDLFDDEIDTLRTFDPETQRTIAQIDELNLLPAKEFPFDAPAIARFRDRWHHTFNVDVRRCSVYQDVSSSIAPNGIEYYLPFFFEGLGTLFDYLPADVLLVLEDDVYAAAEQHLEEVHSRYESLRHDIERPILPPADLYLSLEELRQQSNAYRRITVSANTEHKHQHAFTSAPLPDLLADSRLSSPVQSLQHFVQETTNPILFVAETAGRREIFDELLRKAEIHTEVVDTLQGYLTSHNHCIAIAQLDEGLLCDQCVIVTETDVLGTRQNDPRQDAGRVIDPEQIVRNLTELSLGAPVVHAEHGVGRYLGLQSLSIDGDNYEFLTLAYADDDKLYVPVTALHLISRYAGADEEHAPLHRLGSDQWEKAKRRAAEKVIDVAAELLDIYARRELKTSHRFSLNEADYEKFAEEFPFEVTPDQNAAIQDTLADMTTTRAMDRLVCGDVGFGKTEVAMRAAFVAVQGGKQVAILVPTTLLAQQHFDSFRDRFANWPVSIESVSRMRSQAELDDVAKRLANGRLDIVVGTHKLLSQDIKFADLGLIVIDEEHRFGVRQKERLKSLRAEVDVLTLT
ncbi:MAG: DEAD/DEAH box helicase, partial [Pseudomonadota bacterium]